MKVFFGILFLALMTSALALTDEQKEKFQAYYTDCVGSTTVDKTLIEKMRAGEFSDDAKLKSYVNCMFGKLGFINEAGELQLDVIKAKIPSDVDRNEASKVIEACKETTASNPDGVAYEAYKCYRENTSTLIKV